MCGAGSKKDTGIGNCVKAHNISKEQSLDSKYQGKECYGGSFYIHCQLEEKALQFL